MLKRRFVYPLLVALALPAIIVATTVLHLLSFRRVIDAQLHSEASILAAGLAPSVNDTLSQPDLLKSRLTALAADPTVLEATVYAASGDSLAVVASTVPTKELVVLTDAASLRSWKTGVTTITPDPPVANQPTSWTVLVPVPGGTSSPALLVLRLAPVAATLSQQIYQESVALLAIGLVVIFLLLINHAKFANYQRLYRGVRQLDRLKGGFISRVSEEMHLPSIAVRNYTTLLEKSYGPQMQGEAKQYLDAAYRQAAIVYTKARQLYQFSLVEYGEISLNLRPVDPAAACQFTYDQFKSVAAAKKLRLVYTPEPAKIQVSVDEVWLREALFNIIGMMLSSLSSGAVEFSHGMAGNGTFRIVLKAEGLILDQHSKHRIDQDHYLELEVAPDVLPELGMNLWLARRIIQRLGGRAEVEVGGGGTAVRIYLPVYTLTPQH